MPGRAAFSTRSSSATWRPSATQLLVFGLIVSALLVLVVAQTWLREMLQVRLREWLTHDLLDRWLAPKRAYLLAQAGEIGVNPDQRVHEDTRHLTDLSTELAVGLLQGTLLLVSFVGVLWVLSSQVVFAVGDRSFSIPGYMVWCALAYAFDRLLACLAGRSSPDPAQCHPLRARGGAALCPGPRQRVRRGDRAARRRAGRAPHPRWYGQPRRHGDARAGRQACPPHLGDFGSRLARHRHADPGRGAGLFWRRPVVRRPDDGHRRLQPGAAIVALVRRAFPPDRRLAGHAAAGHGAARGSLPRPIRPATNRVASGWSTMLRDISGSRTSASRSAVVAPRSTTPGSRSPRASAS